MPRGLLADARMRASKGCFRGGRCWPQESWHYPSLVRHHQSTCLSRPRWDGSEPIQRLRSSIRSCSGASGEIGVCPISAGGSRLKTHILCGKPRLLHSTAGISRESCGQHSRTHNELSRSKERLPSFPFDFGRSITTQGGVMKALVLLNFEDPGDNEARSRSGDVAASSLDR